MLKKKVALLKLIALYVLRKPLPCDEGFAIAVSFLIRQNARGLAVTQQARLAAAAAAAATTNSEKGGNKKVK